VQGILDLLLLKIIAVEPQYGSAISQRLKKLVQDDLGVSDGSLYPALHQLELAGWITAEWKTSRFGYRERFYALTDAGRQRPSIRRPMSGAACRRRSRAS
jgi:PadR family transcriptional regulator PadR